MTDAGVMIRIAPASAETCASCGACRDEGADGGRLLCVSESAGLTLGTRVLVETSPVSRVSASFLLLLVPLLGLAAGAIGGTAVGPTLGLGSEGGAVLGGLLLLVLSYLGVAVADRMIRGRGGRVAPHIVAILDGRDA